MQGVFLWSLVATDVCSGWTEAVASGGTRAVPGGRGLGGDPPPVPHPDQGDRLGQRQRLHQRDAAGLLPATEVGVHTVAGLPEERPGLDRAEERRGRPALRRLRASRGDGGGPVPGPTVPVRAAVRELLPAVDEAAFQDPQRGPRSRRPTTSRPLPASVCWGTPRSRRRSKRSYGPSRAGWIRWSCCTASGTPRLPWRH